MSKGGFGAAAAALLVIVLPAWGQAPPPEQDSPAVQGRVKVVGRAAGTTVRSGDEAVAAAKRTAVEMVCGAFINAQSQTQDYVLVRDRILSQAAGYVTQWKELRRWTEEDVTCVEIEAEVAATNFERDWAMFAHLKENEGNPRMVVVILEDNDVDDFKKPILHGICQSRFENFFLEQDVQLMDQRVSDDVRKRDLEQAALDDDITKLAAVAAEFKAEVLVFGRAEARRGGTLELGTQTLERWDVTLNVRAVQADSAAMLMSNSYKPDKPYSTTSTASGDEAFRKLSDEVAGKVLQDIAKAWNKRENFRRILTVKFTDCSRREAKSICEALAQHRGVVGGPEGVKLRNFNHSVADVEVDWQFDLESLADMIEELPVEGLVFDITEQTANRLDVKVTHQ